MKFVHIADVHLDVPFTTLEGKNLSDERRLEQREAIKNVISYIKENNIPYLFICGDLYEHEYVRESTILYLNNLFKSIPETKIFITPGNHDPYIKNSYYKNYNWANNVNIFTSKIEKIEDENVCIFGYGFDDFYMRETKCEEIEIEEKNKINIFLTHGDLDGRTGEDGIEYNPISKAKLKELGFDYVGLGHIHKLSYKDEPNQKIVYCGSLISMGFDELGKHRNDFRRDR